MYFQCLYVKFTYQFTQEILHKDQNTLFTLDFCLFIKINGKMPCICMELYLVQRNPKRFRLQSGIHRLVMANNLVATTAQGHMDRSKAAKNQHQQARRPPSVGKAGEAFCPRTHQHLAGRSWNRTRNFQVTSRQIYTQFLNTQFS